MNTKLPILWLCAVGLIVSCVPQEQKGLDSDIAAIDDVWKRYAERINAGDAEGWASLWTDDGIQMPPGRPSIAGRQRIGDGVGGAMDLYTFDQDITIDETVVAGDWAFSRGVWISRLTPKGEGQALLIDGKFVTIFRRQSDGGWKIYRDIHNSNTESFLTPTGD